MPVNKTFKDFLMEDLDVFFNVEEIASEHVLDGESVSLVIVDNDSESSTIGKTRDHIYASQESYQQLKTLYVKTTDYLIPKISSIIVLDDEEYYVEAAGEENGVVRIIVSANES